MINKKSVGVSLIVLVITILVVIILAATVILTLSKNNPIEGAKEARFKEDVRNFVDELNLTHSNNILKNQDYEVNEQNANGYDEMKKFIPSITEEYAKKLAIKNGKLIYIGKDKNERKWAADIGIGYEMSIDEILEDANKNPEDYRPGDQTGDSVGLDAKGNPVNMDLWKFTKDKKNNTYTLTGYIGEIVNGKIIGEVPQYISDDGKSDFGTVISLSGTFNGNENIEIAPKFPSSITSIGEVTFNGCRNLASITIPDSVTVINRGAFYDCSKLEEITIPNGVTAIYGAGIYSDGGAFQNCTNLKKITIPDTVTSIGECVFKGCNSLTNIEIPNSVTSIGREVFSGCGNLASIEIPENLTVIHKGAFLRM